MEIIEIRIETKSPLSMGGAKAYAGTLVESGSYVKGGHIRGALAAIKPHANPSEGEQIDEVLAPGHQGVLMPNCYPAIHGASLPLPVTAYSCKSAAAGFRPRSHGVLDTLLTRLAYDSFADPWSDRRIPIPYRFPACPVCGRRTEPFEGFAERPGGGRYSKSQVFKHRQTRVAINRKRLTHEESQLYSVSAIDAGTVFVGVTAVHESRVDSLLNCLALIERLGGRSSRGFGRVEVSGRKIPNDSTVADRIRSLNQKYRSVVLDLSSIAIDPVSVNPDKLLFTITLCSDAILRCPDGLPTTDLSPAALRAGLEPLVVSQEERSALTATEIALVSSHTRSLIVSGWNIAWRLPKETLLASRMGTVYAFEATCAGANADTLMRLLARLEEHGIGEFREDGYGQIKICDEFHLEVEPV
jgi:CRISPR-associated protein Csx10